MVAMAHKGPLSDEHRAKIKATWDAKRVAAGGVLTSTARPAALVRAAETTIAKYTPAARQLSHLDRALLTAYARHLEPLQYPVTCVLSMVVWPPASTDHVRFTCTCGASFEVSGFEAASYIDR